MKLITKVWSVTWTHRDDDNNYGTLLFLEQNSAVFVAGSFDGLPGYRTRVQEHHLSDVITTSLVDVGATRC